MGALTSPARVPPSEVHCERLLVMGLPTKHMPCGNRPMCHAPQVMGLMLQILAARIGVVTGRDLAETVHQSIRAGSTILPNPAPKPNQVRQEYPRWLNYVIYGMMEIAVIGSDIQAIEGDRWRSREIEGDRW